MKNKKTAFIFNIDFIRQYITGIIIQRENKYEKGVTLSEKKAVLLVTYDMHGNINNVRVTCKKQLDILKLIK